jgi:hypothetical protein
LEDVGCSLQNILQETVGSKRIVLRPNRFARRLVPRLCRFAMLLHYSTRHPKTAIAGLLFSIGPL